MKQFVILFTTFLLLGTTGPALAQCEKNEIRIRFSHEVDTDRHPKGIAATKLAERVNREMNGMACMLIYPLSSLFDDTSVVDAIAKGDVEMAAPSLSNFSKYARGFQVFEMPFMFRDASAVAAFQGSDTGNRLKNSMVKAGIQGLTYWHGGMRQLAANRPILGPDEINGLRIGTGRAGAIESQLAAAGFKPQVVDAKGMYRAADAGQIDAVDVSWADLFRNRLYQLQPNIVQTNHAVDDYLLIVSTKLWGTLTPAARAKLWSIVWSHSLERNNAVRELQRGYLKRIVSAGVSVSELSAEQRADWVNHFQPNWTR